MKNNQPAKRVSERDGMKNLIAIGAIFVTAVARLAGSEILA